jgi:hypothetical protein
MLFKITSKSTGMRPFLGPGEKNLIFLGQPILIIHDRCNDESCTKVWQSNITVTGKASFY